MTFIIVFACLILVVKGTTTSDHQPHLIDRGAPIPPITPEEFCKNLNSNTVHCLDCTTLVYCYELSQQLPHLIKCGGNYPYCDNTRTTCTENPNPFSCGIDNFVCTKPDGVFPHPTNCSLFYVCENSYANLFECSPNQVWSGNGMVCKDKTCPSDCGTFNCEDFPETKQPYSINKAYYAKCGEIIDGQQVVTVHKCDHPNENFNKYYCDFVCNDIKLYEDSVDQSRYYECTKNGNELSYQPKQCTFNENMQRCTLQGSYY